MNLEGEKKFFGSIFFGCFILFVAQTLGVDNVKEAISDISHSTPAFFSCALLACSIAVFNVCGQKITKNISAMARSALDSTRTIVVWGAELCFGWRPLAYDTLAFWVVQPLGFVFIVMGQMLYFNTVKIKALMGAEEIAAMEGRELDKRLLQGPQRTRAQGGSGEGLEEDLEVASTAASSRDRVGGRGPRGAADNYEAQYNLDEDGEEMQGQV
eukprot:g7065.t1